MSYKWKIHVVEDDKNIQELIHFNLLKEGFEAFCSSEGEEALLNTKSQNPDLIVLDLMLPKLDGFEVIKNLRGSENYQKTPIIILSAKGEESDIVKALELGADDYMVKPFSPKVLIARVKSVLRRVDKKENENQVQVHGIVIDSDKRIAHISGKELELTYTEFQILYLFLRRPGRVYTRAQIVDSVRGSNHAITDRAVDVQIVGLRKKLECKGNLIETVRGVGYRLKDV